MVISIIGYRGTGKTTVAHLLAERLGWTWLDTDSQIEKDAGVTIRQIFQSQGEERFRDYESSAIANATKRFKTVLSLGGGAVLRHENRDAIKRAGPVIWLTASAAELHRRITDDPMTADQRPKLTDQGGLEEIESLLAARRHFYQECADCQIDTERISPKEIVDQIITSLDLRS